jgi:hypothetical protein
VHGKKNEGGFIYKFGGKKAKKGNKNKRYKRRCVVILLTL